MISPTLGHHRLVGKIGADGVRSLVRNFPIPAMHYHWASVGFSLLLAVVFAIPSAFSKERPSPEQEEKSVQAAVVEVLEHHYRFENDGTGVVTSRVRVHIRTEEGRQKYGQLFFPFRAKLQEIHLDYVRTLKPTGEIIEAPVDQAMEITAPVSQ